MDDAEPSPPQRLKPGKPSAAELAALDPRWRLRYLLLAPHRLGFTLALVVLLASSLWWVLVQFDRVSVAVTLPYVVSPTLVHAAAMGLGFMPLFFAGFLFTAVPKWLRIEALDARLLLAPLALQSLGWLSWLVGAHFHLGWVMGGLALVWSGLARLTWLYWRMIWRSKEEDRLHARLVGWACLWGCVCLAGLLMALAVDEGQIALAWVLSGLWGFVAVVFITVAHRMIPFFTSSAMPFIEAPHPFWALGVMFAAAVFEVVAVWLDVPTPFMPRPRPLWGLVRGLFELLAGGVLLWLAAVWGILQSLKNRMLAMLHVGFLWLGLALVLGGLSQLLGWLQSAPVLSLGALHALTMGCLGSLMLTMVTRVSCGHSGRAAQADATVWTLFWVLQAATLLRIAASVQGSWAVSLLLPTALLWCGIMLVWGSRLLPWFGRVRPDGRAG